MNEQKATAIIPYNPLSFIHDPTFLPNQPPLSPLPLFLLLLAYLPFPLSIYFCRSVSLSLSLSLRSLFLSTFVSRYLGDPATGLPVSYVFVVFVRLHTRPLLYTCTARASVCRVRPSWNMYIIDMYTYVKCQSKRIRRRRGTSMSEHNTGCGIQAELLFHSTEV